MLGSRFYSAFDPRTLGGCALWLDAADSNAYTLSGSNVTQWRDKSGNGNTSTILGTPVRTATPFNGVPVFQTTTSDAFVYDPLTNPANTETLSLYIVGTLSTPNNFGRLWSTGLRSDGTVNSDYARDYNFVIYKPDTGTSLTLNRNITALADQAVSSNTPFLVEAHFDGTNGYMYYNGSLVASNPSTGTFLFDKVALSRNSTDQTIDSWAGGFAEVILFYGMSSVAQRQAIQGYLVNKWRLGSVSSYSVGSPASIPSLALWFDAADSSSYDVSGSVVTVWRDKSGNARHTDSRAQSPVLSNNSVISRTGVYFDGSSYFSGPFSYSSNTLSWFVVGTIDSGGGSFGRVLSFADSNTSDTDSALRLIAMYRASASPVQSYRNGAIIAGGTTLTFGSPFLFSGTIDGSSNAPFQNAGAVTGATTTGNFGFTRYGLSANTGGTIEPGKGFLFEVLVYSNALTTTQRQQMENYLLGKWGISRSRSITLPTTHPYRLAPPVLRSFTPLDVPNCTMWLDANGGSSLDLSGTSVSRWRDKSGNGWDMVQSTDAQKPTYSSNTLFFDGASYNMAGTKFSNVITAAEYTVFTVATVLSARATLSYNDSCIVGDSDAYTGIPVSSTQVGVYNWNGGAQYAAVSQTLSNRFLFTGRHGSASIFASLNGSNASSTGSGNTDALTGTMYLGKQYYFSPNTSFRIGELIYYNRSLSSPEVRQVESYLASKWGLRGSTPSNHPARISPGLSVQFTPLQVSNLAIWLDAADQSTLTLSGSNVTAWRDKSSLARTFTGTTVVYTSASGFPCLRFSSNSLTVSSNYAVTDVVTSNANFTCFTVVNVSNTTGTNSSSIGVALSTDNNWRFRTFYSPNSTTVFFDGAFTANPRLSSTYTQNTRQIHGFNRNSGSNLMFRRNGATIASNTTATPSNWNTSSTYTAAIGLGNIFVGDIHEVLYFSNDIGVAAMQQVEGYLARKWGLLTDLSSTNPYKATPLF